MVTNTRTISTTSTFKVPQPKRIAAKIFLDNQNRLLHTPSISLSTHDQALLISRITILIAMPTLVLLLNPEDSPQSSIS